MKNLTTLVDAATVVTGEPPMCDFCGERHTPLTHFRAADFVRQIVVRGDAMVIGTCMCHTPIPLQPGDDVTEQNNWGAWAACRDCAAAIRKNDAHALAALAYAKSQFDPKPPIAWFVAVQAGYWIHRESDG